MLNPIVVFNEIISECIPSLLHFFRSSTIKRNDRAKAVEILANDLKVLATCKEQLYKEMRSINF
ncbi:unnamed protein product [Brassica oleracea var. botrytis]